MRKGVGPKRRGERARQQRRIVFFTCVYDSSSAEIANQLFDTQTSLSSYFLVFTNLLCACVCRSPLIKYLNNLLARFACSSHSVTINVTYTLRRLKKKTKNRIRFSSGQRHTIIVVNIRHTQTNKQIAHRCSFRSFAWHQYHLTMFVVPCARSLFMLKNRCSSHDAFQYCKSFWIWRLRIYFLPLYSTVVSDSGYSGVCVVNVNRYFVRNLITLLCIVMPSVWPLPFNNMSDERKKIDISSAMNFPQSLIRLFTNDHCWPAHNVSQNQIENN